MRGDMIQNSKMFVTLFSWGAQVSLITTGVYIVHLNHFPPPSPGIYFFPNTRGGGGCEGLAPPPGKILKLLLMLLMLELATSMAVAEILLFVMFFSRTLLYKDISFMACWVTFSAYTAREVDNISHKSSDSNRFVAVEMIKFSKSKIYLEKSFIITSTQVFSSTLHG